MRFAQFIAQVITASRSLRKPAVRLHATTELPGHEYCRRLTEREQQLAKIRTIYKRLWVGFTAAVTASCVIGFSSLLSLLPLVWMLPPLAAAASAFHSLTQLANKHTRISKIIGFYEIGIARLCGRWQGIGASGEQYPPKEHLYAADLDLFGSGSLFELLCTARTGMGGSMLADWLLNPADLSDVSLRQLAVAELRDRLDLQEDWAAIGDSAASKVESSALESWASAPAVVFPAYLRVLAIVLPGLLLMVSALVYVGFFGSHWAAAIAVPVALEAVVTAVLFKRTSAISNDITLPAFELGLIAPLLDRFCMERFESPLLTTLQLRVVSEPGYASRTIRHLRFWALLLDLCRSEYFAAIFSLLLLGTNVAMAVERWRERHRDALLGWLSSVAQFEALLCLARYYYENPDHTFPVLRPGPRALFHAESLGHPLLNQNVCVTCNLTLDAAGCQLMLVTGSNMSGKSTLLRSVGTNAVLAFAGAPVRAARLEISSLAIGCCISVHDSLVDGKSKFAAEVKRLRWIISTSQSKTTLFLLDEVLAGTNSTDRFFGAKALLDELVARGAIGLATTHDLALAELAICVATPASNVHFKEHYEGGELHFDYKVYPGVLPGTKGKNMLGILGLLQPH